MVNGYLTPDINTYLRSVSNKPTQQSYDKNGCRWTSIPEENVFNSHVSEDPCVKFSAQ